MNIKEMSDKLIKEVEMNQREVNIRAEGMKAGINLLVEALLKKEEEGLETPLS